MSEILRYVVVFKKSIHGYGAYVPDLPGCVTVGDSLKEARSNIREAIAAHIDIMRARGEAVIPPTSLTETIEIPAA